ncbi:hypothetical protein M404DRAFT_28896 [Pisolithus tinctorius Marx 270]|uniref:CCHC-type domain-containing protein n=1 Tax=Pisolithus tinctorius Marx 270 TaxID=870435 RepID=A0A0C3P1F1_PISTI|nr:hypothetical protein M404DRAFT_28896 [Pisolithus tinctorius Marx 270]
MPTSTNPMTPLAHTSIAMPVPHLASQNHQYAPPERTYQPLHDSVASATRPYPYPVICSVPAMQRAHKDTRKGKSKAPSGPPKPRYDPTFRACNTPPLSQAGYRSPSPLPHAGPSHAAPSVAPADLSTPSVAPAAPSTGKWVAPEASIFLGYVQLLNDFKRWESHGWRAGECHEHLWVLSKIFRSSEVIGKRVHDQVATAEGSFEAHTYEDIDKANSSILQEALKTQEAVVKIIHEDYGPSLISSFRAFLDRTPVDIVVRGLLPLAYQATTRGSGLPPDPDRKEARKVAGEETSRKGSVQPGFGGGGKAVGDVEPRCHDCWEKIIPGQGREHFQAIADSLASIPFNGSPRNWLDFFTQARGDAAGRAIFNTTQTSRALPATPFVPIPVSSLSKRELGGLVPIDWQHPLHQFACYRCSHLGHWSSDCPTHSGN